MRLFARKISVVNNRGGDFMHVMKLVDMNFLFPKMIGVDETVVVFP